MPDTLPQVLAEAVDLEVPAIDPRVVHYLDRVYPEKCPDPRDTEREIWMKAGERRLVVWLRNIANRDRS